MTKKSKKDSVISKCCLYIESEVREAYESCVLPDKVTEWICTRRSQGQSLNTVQGSLSLYTSSEVEETYSDCGFPVMNDISISKC